MTLKKVAESLGFKKSPMYLGEKYYYGLETGLDYIKAVKYFAQADEQGNAYGTYMLGCCYYHGYGVEQDVGKALEIFKRCAKMNPKQKRNYGSESSLGFNSSVAAAERAIGRCYELGTGVDKNLSEAALWCTKAMQHGDADAARCLGFFYCHGNGVRRNEKMAEMCWKQGLNLGSTVSAEHLVKYYIRSYEPEIAWIMFQIAREI